MGSAFMPVKSKGRTAFPMPLTSGLNSGAGGNSLRPKRARQGSSLKQMLMLNDIDVDTPPDNISVTASEASTKGSYHSQPPLLDFVGAACCASSWFTSCFPCAILDINDNDDRVVDKLSRESAMNVMYSNTLCDDSKYMDTEREQDSNIMFIRLPEQETSDAPHNHPIPVVIEEDSDEDEAADSMSLSADADSMPVAIVQSVDKISTFSAPKRMKFGIQKLFGRRRQ
jgi:hypothetical protein